MDVIQSDDSSIMLAFVGKNAGLARIRWPSSASLMPEAVLGAGKGEVNQDGTKGLVFLASDYQKVASTVSCRFEIRTRVFTAGKDKTVCHFCLVVKVFLPDLFTDVGCIRSAPGEKQKKQ